MSDGASNIDGGWTDEVFHPQPDDECLMTDVAADAPGYVESVCAHPKDYMQTLGRVNPPAPTSGVLYFEYSWQSTTGNVSDLGQCSLREYVPYDRYPFPSPPFASNATPPENPHIRPFAEPATAGGSADIHSTAEPHRAPYSAVIVTGAQKYQYSCPCSAMGAWTDMYTTPGGIIRSFSQQGSSWFFQISKNFVTSTQGPLP
jgi:hypothetical protein